MYKLIITPSIKCAVNPRFITLFEELMQSKRALPDAPEFINAMSGIETAEQFAEDAAIRNMCIFMVYQDINLGVRWNGDFYFGSNVMPDYNYLDDEGTIVVEFIKKGENK